jgi:hypothetical protein
MVASPKVAKASDTAVSFAGVFALNFTNINGHNVCRARLVTLLFTFLVGDMPVLLACPQVMSFLAKVACPLNDIIFC